MNWEDLDYQIKVPDSISASSTYKLHKTILICYPIISILVYIGFTRGIINESATIATLLFICTIPIWIFSVVIEQDILREQ